MANSLGLKKRSPDTIVRKSMDHWNRTENTEINQIAHGNFIQERIKIAFQITRNVLIF